MSEIKQSNGRKLCDNKDTFPLIFYGILEDSICGMRLRIRSVAVGNEREELVIGGPVEETAEEVATGSTAGMESRGAVLVGAIVGAAATGGGADGCSSFLNSSSSSSRSCSFRCSSSLSANNGSYNTHTQHSFTS